MVMNYNKKTSDNKVKVVTEHTDWLMNTELELPDNQLVSVIIFTPNESYYQPRVNNECLSHRSVSDLVILSSFWCLRLTATLMNASLINTRVQSIVNSLAFI